MPTTATEHTVTLSRQTNQAAGLGRFAVDFLRGGVGEPSPAVLDRTVLFFTDSVLCGLSALALGTNAPTVLRDEALQCPAPDGAGLRSSRRSCPDEAG